MPSHCHADPQYRAVVHGRKGELKEAVRWNQQSLTLNPEYFPALVRACYKSQLKFCLALSEQQITLSVSYV